MMRQLFVFLIVSFIGSFIYFGLGFCVFDLLLAELSRQHTTSFPGFSKTAEHSWLFMYLSCFAYALIISYLSALTYKNKSPLQAFVQGASVGLLIACMTDFYWYATTNYYKDLWGVWIDCLGAVICVGALGLSTYVLFKKLA